MTGLKAFKAVTIIALLLSMQLLPAVDAASSYTHDEQMELKLGFPVYSWGDQQTPKAIVIPIHGMTLHARRFDALAKHLADQDFLVCATDLRGFGARQNLPIHEEGRTAVHYRYSEEDIIRLMEALKQRYPNAPLYCVGESLGANMAIDIAAAKPDLVAGVIAVSPCIKRCASWSPRQLMDVIASLVRPYRLVSLKPYVAKRLSEDPRVVEHYTSDPLIRQKLTVAELLKSLGANKRCIESLRKLPESKRVLVIAGEKDKIYKASILDDFVAESTSKQIQLHILKQKGHLLLEHDYLDGGIVALIDTWLDNSVAQASSTNRSAMQTAPSSAAGI